MIETLLTKLKQDPENEALRCQVIEEIAKSALNERKAAFEELAK